MKKTTLLIILILFLFVWQTGCKKDTSEQIDPVVTFHNIIVDINTFLPDDFSEAYFIINAHNGSLINYKKISFPYTNNFITLDIPDSLDYYQFTYAYFLPFNDAGIYYTYGGLNLDTLREIPFNFEEHGHEELEFTLKNIPEEYQEMEYTFNRNMPNLMLHKFYYPYETMYFQEGGFGQTTKAYFFNNNRSKYRISPILFPGNIYDTLDFTEFEEHDMVIKKIQLNPPQGYNLIYLNIKGWEGDYSSSFFNLLYNKKFDSNFGAFEAEFKLPDQYIEKNETFITYYKGENYISRVYSTGYLPDSDEPDEIIINVSGTELKDNIITIVGEPDLYRMYYSYIYNTDFYIFYQLQYTTICKNQVVFPELPNELITSHPEFNPDKCLLYVIQTAKSKENNLDEIIQPRLVSFSNILSEPYLFSDEMEIQNKIFY